MLGIGELAVGCQEGGVGGKGGDGGICLSVEGEVIRDRGDITE